MKLASSQRPHAPPVPPRPSRQVVAEALKKKSAQLLCPTRQAPPPPNHTQPWRANDEISKHNDKGITVNHGDKLISNDVINDLNENSLLSQSDNRDNTMNNKLMQRCDPFEESHNFSDNRSVDNLQRRIKKFNDLSNSVNNYENLTIKHRCIYNSNNKNYNYNYKNNNSNIHNNINNKSNDREEKTSTMVNNNSSNGSLSTYECAETCIDSTKQCSESDSNIFSIKSSNNSQQKMTVLVTVNKNDSNTPINVDNKLTTMPNNAGPSSTVSNDDCATVVVIDKENNNKIIINNDDDNKENIHKEDWLEAGIHYSTTKITLAGDNVNANVSNINNHLEHHQSQSHSVDLTQSDLNYSSLREKIVMTALQGLPPLPRSLSGLYLNKEGLRENNEPPPPPPTRSSSKLPKLGKTCVMQPTGSNSRRSPPARQFVTNLDTQLAILRKEMFGLRQLDLSLLSQLWSLNESIQDFRQLIQEHEDRVPSPSPSSEEGDDVTYNNHPPAPPRRLPAQHSHQHHYHHHHHHHRPPRPPRPLRPLPSDESPSSEEYGAV